MICVFVSERICIVIDCCTTLSAAVLLLAFLCILLKLRKLILHAFILLCNAFTDQLDLSLIGWVLLLLSRSLDSVRLSNSDDIERCGSKEREGSGQLCNVCKIDQWFLHYVQLSVVVTKCKNIRMTSCLVTPCIL